MVYLRILSIVFLSISSTCAQPLDIGNLTVEEYVDQILESLKKELPDGEDISCVRENRFAYAKKSWNSYAIKPEALSSVCKSINEYDSFIFGELNNYWNIADSFGLEVALVGSSDDLNGAYGQRPILNKQTLPKFTLYHYENIKFEENYPIWSHEYGHAILGSFLDEHFFQLSKSVLVKKINLNLTQSELSNKLSKLSTRQDELYDKIDKLDSIRDNHNQSQKEEYEKLLNELAEVNTKYSIVDNNLEESIGGYFKYISFLIGPYHEFFADVFAGLFHNDINVVGNNFDLIGTRLESYSDQRRFLPKEEVILAKQWINYQTHLYFTPSRHFLGKLDLSILDTEEKKKEFMQRLAKYIVIELQRIIEKSSSDCVSS